MPGKSKKTKGKSGSAGSGPSTSKRKTGDVNAAVKRRNPVAENQQAMMPGVGSNPPVREVAPTSYASAVLAHTMSLLNPWDSKYNGAKVPSDCPIDSAIFKTHEIIVCGSPTAAASGFYPPGQTFNGFGGFIMRPGALGRSYQYTSGSDNLGFPTGASGPGLVAISSGNAQSLVLNMMANPSDNTTLAPVLPEQHDLNAWLAPMAMSDIQLLCSKFRTTSAGLRVTYIGPEITESGELAMGTVPYDKFIIQDLEYDSTVTFSFNTIPWQDFVNYKGTVVTRASNGGHMRYLPLDTKAYEWRETVLSFPICVVDAAPPFLKGAMNGSTLRRNVRRRGFNAALQKVGGPLGLNVKVRSNGTVKIAGTAQVIKTVDSTGKTTSKKTVFVPPEDEEPRKLGAVWQPSASVPWFHGNPGDGTPGLPQPEDCQVDEAKVFIQAIMAGFQASGSGIAPTPGDINDLLNNFQDQNWSESEDLMVVMWNNIAPATAILEGGDANNWAGALFQIDKYVNYECILDLNALDIGSMPPSPGVMGSSAASTGLAKAIAPVAAPAAPPKSESFLTKAGNWLSNAKQTLEPWIEAGTKAWQVGSAIADAVGAFL